MSEIAITINLPEELVKRARAQGLLDGERLAHLLATEIERREAWQRLNEAVAPAREAFRADHADMSEADVIAMLDDLVRLPLSQRSVRERGAGGEGQIESSIN